MNPMIELSPAQQQAICELVASASAALQSYVCLELRVTSMVCSHDNARHTEFHWRFYNELSGHAEECRLLSDAYESLMAANTNSEKMLAGALELEAKAHLIRKRLA